MTRVEAELPDGSWLTLDDGVLDAAREELAGLGRAAPVRLAYAAAHLVLKESYRDCGHSLERPGTPEQIEEHIDWEQTVALRARLDRLGFGIAEAMDTAQRFEIGWRTASRLIEACGELAPGHGFIAGAGVDHLARVDSKSDLVDGVVYQARFVQAAGGWPILLPMVWLAEQRAGEADYVEVYGEIVRQLEGPLFVHWLGEMFLPALRGYFPGQSFARVMALDPGKLRGAKLSLLDADLELRVRRELLTRDQLLLSGDDLHFARLLRGADPAREESAPRPERHTHVGGRAVALGDFSHALLGVFDAVAEPAGLALQLLAHGKDARALELLAPCEDLGRRLFEPPTRHYKAGLAYLSWLNGLQPNAMLANREDLARDSRHLSEVTRLAVAAGCVADATTAAKRLGSAG